MVGDSVVVAEDREVGLFSRAGVAGGEARVVVFFEWWCCEGEVAVGVLELRVLGVEVGGGEGVGGGGGFEGFGDGGWGDRGGGLVAGSCGHWRGGGVVLGINRVAEWRGGGVELHLDYDYFPWAKETGVKGREGEEEGRKERDS